MKKLLLISLGLFVASQSIANVASNLDEAQVGELATAYFKAHPEKMLEIMQSMQQALKEQQYNGVKRILIKNRNFLLSQALPSIGPSDASKALIFFYDYQCVYCHKQYPVLEQLLKKDKTLKVVFVPLHLFGQASLYASKMGLYFNRLGRFAEFNTALENANLIEGRLSEKGVDEIASQLHVNLSKAQAFIKSDTANQLIAKIDALKNQLGIQATPMMFTLPTQQENLAVNDVHVIQGYTRLDRLKLTT